MELEETEAIESMRVIAHKIRLLQTRQNELEE
jgi:hypothetical protein